MKRPIKSVFKKSRLDNGMILLTERAPQFQTLSVGVWVNAGTRHEGPGEEGLSHYLEHMMFKGTETRSALDIALEVDRVGGEFNAFTSREYTCFHILLLGRDVSLATDILTDVLLNSRFDADEVERERKVILQEIAMTQDNPEEYVHDIFFEKAFGGHALGKPILGSPGSIAKVSRELLVSYFRRHYSPSQMVIAVAGDVEHSAVERLLNRHLRAERFKANGAKKLNLNRPRLAPGGQIIRRDVEQVHIVAGFPGLPHSHKDRFAGYLLNLYLGGGMSSSLFQEIREKRGLAYTVYSNLSTFSDSGLFSVYAATSPSEVATCLQVMGCEFGKLKAADLDRDALEILKSNITSAILMNLDSVENRMTSIAKAEMFFERYYSTEDMIRAINRVTAKDVRKLANQMFKPGRLMLCVAGPYGGRGKEKRATPSSMARLLAKEL